MLSTHLYILHLFGNTENDKVNQVADQRFINLMGELQNQGINDFSLIGGFYDQINTKEAIHKGHRKIVQYAKDLKLPFVIIAEDDIVFTAPGAWQYFLSQIPQSYDLFCGLMYSGTVEEGRIKNGASGVVSLYSCHSRFYDFFLSLDTNTHIDREIGLSAYKHEYYLIDKMVVTQRGGYSYNLRKEMWYEPYLEGKVLFGQ